MAAVRVLGMISDVYLSGATIGQIGRGVGKLDAELLTGVAAVLGIPVEVLGRLTGVSVVAENGWPPEWITDAAALIREVRHLPAAQVREVTRFAHAMGER